MLEAIELMLKRIETNPEEFTQDLTGRYVGKWARLLTTMPSWASIEEQDAIKVAINKAIREKVNEIAYKILTGEEDPKEEDTPLSRLRQATGMPLVGQMQAQSSAGFSPLMNQTQPLPQQGLLSTIGSIFK